MLSKEECEQALMNICSSNSKIEDRKIFKDLINEHFELVEKYDALYNRHLKQIQSLIYEREDLKSELSNYLNPQPYKLKDLKVGMWVWDSKIEKCNKILEINNDKIGFYYVTDNLTRFTCKFEENRFYPVQMANVGCE